MNGRRVLHRRGHDIRRITLRHLPAGRSFTLRIEAFNSRGAETIGVRRYTGCAKKKRSHRDTDPD